MMSLTYCLYVAAFATLFATAAVALYGVLAKENVLKKVIALTILGDTVNTVAILAGFRVAPRVAPPILPTLRPSREALKAFASTAVDPVPQALVITAIVINLAVTAFLLFLAVRAYALYGTLNYGEIMRVRRGEGA